MRAQHSIGALSKQTGCNVETIRYYEREGLWTPPPRTAGGQPHVTKCLSDTPCEIYVHQDEGFDFVRVE